VSILHQNPLEGVKGTLNLLTAFYLGIKWKSRGWWGFLNFVPKIKLADLKFWEQKLFYSLFLPQFWTQGAESFWVLTVLGDTHSFWISRPYPAQEGGNTVCWKAVARQRTVDDSMTYWFPWKHPMVRRRGLEFGVFDQTPQKWAHRLGPMGLVAQ